jgi:hypothetical protein
LVEKASMTFKNASIGVFLLSGWLLSSTYAKAEERYLLALLVREGSPAPRVVGLFVKLDMDASRGVERVECRAVAISPGRTATELPAKDLAELAQTNGAQLTGYGPFVVKKDFYDRGARSFEQLKADDLAIPENTSQRQGLAGQLPTGAPDKSRSDPWAADETHLLVVRGLAPWLQPPGKAPDWLWERLGLDKNSVRTASLPTSR